MSHLADINVQPEKQRVRVGSGEFLFMSFFYFLVCIAVLFLSAVW